MKTKIPSFIMSSPDDNGNADTPENWAWVIQHEIDLYEEGQDDPDIKNNRQYQQAKKCLESLLMEQGGEKV